MRRPIADSLAAIGAGAATALALRSMRNRRRLERSSSSTVGAAPPVRNIRLRNKGFVYRPVGDHGEPYPDWVRALKGQSGVYVIRQDGETVYVGESHSNRLYETLTRHLQTWRRWKTWWRDQFGEGHDPGLTYDRASVEVAVRITAPNEAIDEEARLIRRLRPRDNLLGRPEEAVPF